MSINENIVKKLDEIVRLLSIIAQPMKKEFYENVTTKFLTTEDRKKMYDLMDGKRSIGDIATIVNVSHEAVRQLVKDLEGEDLIIILKKDKSNIPKKLF